MQNKPVYIKPGKIPLTKEQQSFNRFAKRIAKLQATILNETDKLTQLSRLYQLEVYPNVIELGKIKIQLCHLLHKKRQEIKLSALQNKKLDALIVDHLSDAFCVIEPDEAAMELLDTYDNANDKEGAFSQDQATQDELSDLFYDRFGVKLDPSAFANSDSFEKAVEEFKNEWEQREPGKKTKRKTKKQLAKEELEAQKAALKNKSIRSVYVALAKILHPDTEQDEKIRAEKEEMMKLVTVAYDNKDLMQLLQLETTWMSKHDEHFNSLDSTTLKAYIHLLADQARELETELYMLYMNPAYAAVAPFGRQELKAASRAIKYEGVRYKEVNKKIKADIEQLELGKRTNATVVKCINEYYQAPEDDHMDYGNYRF